MDGTPDIDAAPGLVADFLTSNAEAARGETVPMQAEFGRIEAAIGRIQAGKTKTSHT